MQSPLYRYEGFRKGRAYMSIFACQVLLSMSPAIEVLIMYIHNSLQNMCSSVPCIMYRDSHVFVMCMGVAATPLCLVPLCLFHYSLLIPEYC